MKTVKFIALATIVMLLTACEKQQGFSDDTLDDSAFSMDGAKSLIADMNNSYLVISNSNRLPYGLEKAIASANGEITNTIPEIGIVIASSDDPGFKGKAAKIKGVRSVVPNLTTQWLDPNDKMKSIDVEENPPSAGDDEGFFWYQWGHDAIDSPEAWNEGCMGDGVRVGVLDTGFDLDHPDLAPRINMTLSKDFTGEGLEYTLGDEFSHGCHTAGIIAAADNAYGVIGVAPEAELVLIKVLRDAGSGSFDDIIAGIIYAALNDVDVINMSIGATFSRRGGVYDDGVLVGMASAREVAELVNAISRAVTFAYQNGTTVITSAGNEATDYDHSKDLIHLPSGVPHAISISATAPIGWAYDPDTNLDEFASYSNYGQSEIDFAAPGGDAVLYDLPGWYYDMVLSTGADDWYYFSAGTSMAAPHAAGVAALIIGKNGAPMDPEEVKAALRASADDLGKKGNDDFYGQGRVNAYNAVTN